MRNEDRDRATKWTTYHQATTKQREAYERINEAALYFIAVVFNQTPSCPDQTVAIRSIRDARMAANATIACNQ